VNLNGSFENPQAVETARARNQNYIHVKEIVAPEIIKYHTMKMLGSGGIALPFLTSALE
jgi:hypothetical protein